MNDELKKKMAKLDPEIRDEFIYLFNSYHSANDDILSKIENVVRYLEYGHPDNVVFKEMNDLFEAMSKPLQITANMSRIIYGDGAISSVYQSQMNEKLRYVNHLDVRLEKVLQERQEKEKEKNEGSHK